MWFVLIFFFSFLSKRCWRDYTGHRQETAAHTVRRLGRFDPIIRTSQLERHPHNATHTLHTHPAGEGVRDVPEHGTNGYKCRREQEACEVRLPGIWLRLEPCVSTQESRTCWRCDSSW